MLKMPVLLGFFLFHCINLNHRTALLCNEVYPFYTRFTKVVALKVSLR